MSAKCVGAGEGAACEGMLAMLVLVLGRYCEMIRSP